MELIATIGCSYEPSDEHNKSLASLRGRAFGKADAVRDLAPAMWQQQQQQQQQQERKRERK
eukprot:2999893-Amphidinium_carterae.1